MKGEKGITLIALIITIIIMITLVAVTVTIALNGGLFNYAGRAAKRTDQEKVREEIQSVLPLYYLESSKMTLQDFLTANLMDDVTGFSQRIETTFNENGAPASSITGYTFFYKGYGFFVEKDSLFLSLLDDLDGITTTDSFGIYELITNIDDLEIGKKYIIVSSNTKEITVDGNTTDAYYVMDKQEEGIDAEDNAYARRSNQLYSANGDTILYSGEYAITIEKEGNNYYLYDSKNKEYLSVEGNENDSSYLGLGNKNEYARVSINISNGVAQIKFLERENFNIIRSNNFYTSCYTSGQKDICLYKYIGTEVRDKLATPTNIQETPDDKQVTLTWDAVDGATSYTVSWQDEEGNQEKKIVEECMVIFEDLENGYTYSYQIRANSTDGSKANSLWTTTSTVVPGSGIFELVTNDSMLEAGTRYIIATSATSGSAYTIGAQNGNYRERVAVTIENNNTILYNDSYYPLRLEGSSSGWKWKDLKTDKTQYLFGGNKAWGYNSQGRTDTCTISINSSTNVANILYGSYYIKYNSSSPRFTGYGSGQSDIYLFKEVGEAGIGTPVVTALGTDKTAKLEWAMETGVTYYLIWNGVESNTAITSPHTVPNLTNGIEYEYQVKAVKDDKIKYSAEGTVTPILTKTYQLITNTSQLESGESYLIVNGKTIGSALTMGESNSNNISTQSVNILNTSPVSIEYSGEDDYKFVFEYSNVNSAWKIHETVSNRYLYTPYNSNALKTDSSDDISDFYDNNETAEESRFTNIDLFNITFDATDGHVNISGIDSNIQDRSIRYNSGSGGIFSFYKTTTQNPVYLFKCID